MGRDHATMTDDRSREAPPVSDPDPTASLGGQPPDRLGPCRILRTLGQGASGSVFLAEMAEERPWAAAGQRVAVKVLHAHLGAVTTAFERFRREGEFGRSIQHPALARTYAADVARDGTRAWHMLIMEYVEGQTLRDR